MKIPYPAETTVFVLLIAVCNLPLINPTALALFPSALFDGELWRWFTYPWAHLSLYHLGLDSTAFLCLYNQLNGSWRTRASHLLCCIAAGGLLPILCDPRLDVIGLRGLSGVAHGLMVICALESICSKPQEKTFGLLVLAGVGAKCMFEQITGNVLFAAYHLGNVGFPVPSCHVGGAIGGAISYFVVKLIKDKSAIGDVLRTKAFAHQASEIK